MGVPPPVRPWLSKHISCCCSPTRAPDAASACMGPVAAYGMPPRPSSRSQAARNMPDLVFFLPLYRGSTRTRSGAPSNLERPFGLNIDVSSRLSPTCTIWQAVHGGCSGTAETSAPPPPIHNRIIYPHFHKLQPIISKSLYGIINFMIETNHISHI